MSAVDSLADKAQAASRRLADSNGLKAKLARELADDASFLRNLKPELIVRRARGELPTNGKPTPAEAAPSEQTRTPSEPQPDRRPRGGGGGPNPFVVVGAALVAGVLLAKWIDWRGHAHPRW